MKLGVDLFSGSGSIELPVAVVEPVDKEWQCVVALTGAIIGENRCDHRRELSLAEVPSRLMTQVWY